MCRRRLYQRINGFSAFTVTVIFAAYAVGVVAGLLVARVLTGLGVGLITATATAYLLELHSAHRPAAGRTASRSSRPRPTWAGWARARSWPERSRSS